MRNRRAKRIISCLLALVLIFGNVQGLSVLAAENGITNTVEESVIPKEEEHLSNEETEESLQQETEETLEPETGDENKTEVVEEEIQKPQKEQVKKEQQDKKQTEEKTEILEEKKEVPVTIEGPTMEITEDDLQNHSFETYYHVEDITYTYKGEVVTFVSDTEFTAGGQIYRLKNKAIMVTFQEAEDGTIGVKLDGVKAPVESISGAWNSRFGGNVQLVYKTDIPGMKEVRSAEGSSLKNTIELKGLGSGTYHLKEGTIYEKANEWSPGYDFGDGNGKVTEGFFGTLPDLTFTVEGDAEKPEPQPESAKLKSLEVVGGTIDPKFDPNRTSYTLKVPNGSKTVEMNWAAESESASISVIDTSLMQGQAGSPLAAEDGKNIVIQVMDGTLFEAYTFLVQEEEKEPEKPVEPTQKLKEVQVTGGTLDPAYDEDNSKYTLYVSEDTKSVSVNTTTYTEDTTVSILFHKQNYKPGDKIPVIDGETIRVTGTLKSGAVTSSKSYLLTFKVMEKSECGFSFSLDGNDLKMKDGGIHEDGTPYRKVMIPKGTANITMVRSKATEAVNQGDFGATIVSKGIGEVDFPTTSYIGKENYFIARVEQERYYVYFQEVEKEEDASLPRMDITEEDMKANPYETYYYSDKMNYYYQDEYVTFTDESHFSAGGETYELKNKKTTVSVEDSEKGIVTVSLSNITIPVGSIPGKWNSGYKGEVVYKTDIPGKEEIRSGELNNPFVFTGLPDGTYHLTCGTIFEKANQWSPGYDFGDGQGVVKEKYFGTLPNITFTVENPIEKPDEYIGVATKAKVYPDFQEDIWLQYQQKEMKVGDKADLYPWRIEQIITDTINNDVFRPEFHFEIISGDSVKLDKENSNEKAIVTAVKPGTSIVKVTYKAADYKGKHWNAISDVNTAYAIFTVGENGKAVIHTNEEFANWRHYDTIYYTEGETVPYTFTVNAENAKSVRVTVNGLPIEGNGNKYTANLENRSNIIGIEAKDEEGNITSMYRVIDSRFMEVIVNNKTNPGEELKAGDTANVSFRGITMPVHKLATIYNPVFGKNVTRVLYENDKLGTFEGKCSQWDLATNNDFDVTFTEEGTYNFHSKDGIRCTWWGDDLGADMIKQGVGKPNLNANDVVGYFSVLPDFTITVAGEDTENPDPQPEEPEKPGKPDPQPDPDPNPQPDPQPDPKPEKPDGEEGDGSKGHDTGNLGGKKYSSGGSVKRVSRKTSKTTSNTVKITVDNHLVSKEEVEKIKGKDKNLRMIDSFADGTKYSMTLNGKEMKNASDINTAIRKESVYEEEIRLLAPEPEILVFEHEGEFPGKVLVELEVEKEDGTYLLFQYDNVDKKAVYVQKIVVNNGKTKFFISEGGDYFIDTKAKVKSVDELTKDEENEWEETEEEVLEVNEIKEEKDYSMLFVGILVGLGVAGVFGAGFLIGKKRRETNE